MALSSDLISQFVKITKDDKKVPTETTVYGTIVYDGKPYVKLDGSDLLTPISTTTDVKDGERVTVMIKDHTATVTGNISSPSARTDAVKDSVSQALTDADIQAGNAHIERLLAVLADIDYLNVDEVKAVTADIEKLRAEFATIGHIDANSAKILMAEIENISAKFGDFTNISVDDLEALNAEITNLKGYTADFTYISAERFEAVKADIKQLNVDKLSAKDADIKYANIDFANIGEAAIRKIFSESGLIKDLVVGDGTVTGELVGVTIKGDLIEGNTVKADKLVVKGSDGIYYKLNIEAGTFASGEAVPDDSLHGSVITAKSITAEKVSVKDLVAFGATIGGFHITSSALYSGVKSTVDNTTKGVYLDSDGQIAIGDSNNFLKYFKDTDGTYKLAISAGSILLSASGKSVEDAIDEIENLEIGGRNLIRNSTNLANEDYYFQSGVATTPTETVSGGIVTIKNISTEDPGLDVSINSEEAGVDLSAVTVTACGKNLFDCTQYTLLAGYVSNKSGKQSGSSNYYYVKLMPVAHLQGQTITLNHPPVETGGENPGMAFYSGIPESLFYEDQVAPYFLGNGGAGNGYTAVVPDGALYMCFSVPKAYADGTQIQIELGDTVTDYEAYSSQSVVTNADGTVEGLTPISPTMNIFADTAGVTVTATYNRVAALSSYQGITPFGDTDEIARLIIEELPEAFIFPDVKTTGQEYTLSFWLKVPDEADEGARMTVNGQRFNASTEWVKQVVTFAADSTDLALEFADPGTYYIYHLQLEIGNKATDWTLAPEDVSSDIADAQSTALGAQNSANNNATNIALAEAAIQQLADSIAALVRDGDGGSLILQDSNGLWYFNIGNIEKNISDTASSLDELSGIVLDANGEIDVLKSTAAALQTRTEYVRSYTDENGQPCLELGEGDSVFKVRITNTEIQFAEGTAVPTRINRKMLIIEKAMVRDEFQFGDDEATDIEGVWIWKRRANGNLGLAWKEVVS